MPASASVSVFAPAKINLTLHVTGQRADGYHLLDSLVAFADVGDEVVIQTGNTLSLTVEGPEAAAVPADKDNLILKVAKMLSENEGGSILLTKNLPVSSGIGGGSADAAAAMRGLMALWRGDEFSQFDDKAARPFAGKLLALGADIPMCLLSEYARVKAIGEEIYPIHSLPRLDAVLVNPRRAISTPSVFKALARRDNPAMPDSYQPFHNLTEFMSWLSQQRNDLEEAAIRLEPSIAEVKTALMAHDSCLLARMSGSGATCFGLYASRQDAEQAARSLATSHPDWWVKAARLGTQTELAMPQPT